MRSPSCGNTILDDAIKCECGYDLTTHKALLYKSFTEMRTMGLFFNSFRACGRSLSTLLLLGAMFQN